MSERQLRMHALQQMLHMLTGVRRKLRRNKQQSGTGCSKTAIRHASHRLLAWCWHVLLSWGPCPPQHHAAHMNAHNH